MVNKAIFKESLCLRKTGIYSKCHILIVYWVGIIVVLLLCIGCSKSSSHSKSPLDNNNQCPSSRTRATITKGQILYDFGYVKPNEKHEIDFTILNPTGNDIQIQRVRSECKCMYAPRPPKTIPANKDTSLKMIFIAPKKPQYYDKKLIVQTTSRLYPLFVLRIKADVDRPLLCRPDKIDVEILGKKVDREISVTIFNRGLNAVRPIYSTSSVEGFIAQIPRAEIPPGGELNIPLKIHLERELHEKGNALVNIHTDLSSQPQIAFKVQYSLANTAK